MKRALLMTMLAASVTLGASGAYGYPQGPVKVGQNSAMRAFPTGPCVLSRGQLLRLSLSVVVTPVR
jgi:hypothetical protein